MLCTLYGFTRFVSLSVLRDEYGWRPKRSLMFGSWDAEEWGLYGSINFNEEGNGWKDRVVAYLNFDMTGISIIL